MVAVAAATAAVAAAKVNSLTIHLSTNKEGSCQQEPSLIRYPGSNMA